MTPLDDDPFAPATRLDGFVAAHEGWRVQGDKARGPCPCCASRTGGWMLIGCDGRPRAGCFSCDNWKAIHAALGFGGAGRSWVRIVRAPSRAEEPRAPDVVADADLLDAVYRVFVRHLGMSAEQRDAVLGRDRGIQSSLRDRICPLLAPLPANERRWDRIRRALVEELRTVAPREFLRRIPELWARAGGSYAVLPKRQRAKYFEPWHDERGRIVALRAYMGRKAKPKYLTPKGRWGPLVHYAFGCEPDAVGTVPWIFNEALMKAEVSAHHFGAVGVAFTGVGAKKSWARALEVYQRLAPTAPAYVAFDAEVWTTRPDIAVTALDLAAAIERVTGRPAGFAVWDARADAEGRVEPKGIDDAIVAGAEVRLVDRAGLGALLRPALDAWESADAA